MNPVFDTWADQHGVSAAARHAYYALLAAPVPHPAPDRDEALSESAIQSHRRLAAARRGEYLWRNNVGAAMTDTGSFVRYGLANDSAALNRVLKSSDLIGLRRVLITPAHVGTVIGQFVCEEVKHGGWRYTGAGREPAQLRFIELVNGMGGYGRFVSDPAAP